MALVFKVQRAFADNQVKDALNETQGYIAEIVRELNLEPFISGVFLTNVTLSTTANLIRHDLGYEPRGWLVLNKQASFDVYKDTSVTISNPTAFIALRTSSGSYTVNLYIF